MYKKNRGRTRIACAGIAALLLTGPLTPVLGATPPPLLPESTVAALADEIDGNRAHRDVEIFALQHRMRASRQFLVATGHIVKELEQAGFTPEVMRFPADGQTMFGTQKARPAWDADFAELWDLEKHGDEWVRRERIGNWEAMPLSLAQDSDSGQVTADLVDVGAGTKPEDYSGKDVRGKLVLISTQPGDAVALAVGRFGAAGLVSYVQNQKTAWWGEDETLVRWGHLDSFYDGKAFAFMISLKQARAFQSRLAAGEPVRLEAVVRAERHAGEYSIATATLPGSDPALANQEIVFSCHLDHPRPGANDNASGCATILEVARTYAKLIREHKLPAPLRAVRFLWPPEVEGTTILLNARPDLARRIVAVVHMDMVGGGPATKAVFHVTRSPASLPNFIDDVAEAIAAFVNAESEAYAGGRAARYPLVAAGGGKEALLAQMQEFDAGSDHEVYADSSFRIPSIYLNDWPDRYIHTTGDVPANIDPTKLERAAFIGAASAWYLANLTAKDVPGLLDLLERQTLRRTITMTARRETLPVAEKRALEQLHRSYESALLDTVARFVPVSDRDRARRKSVLEQINAIAGSTAAVPSPRAPGSEVVYARCADPKGPMSVFGYDYLVDHLGRQQAEALALPNYEGLRGGGDKYALEALNFIDGHRSAGDVRDALSAEFGPVPLEPVMAYLQALAQIKVIAPAPAACAGPPAGR